MKRFLALIAFGTAALVAPIISFLDQGVCPIHKKWGDLARYGFIDPAGTFWRCARIEHRWAATAIRNALHLDPRGDAEIQLAALGWIWVCDDLFTWDWKVWRPNLPQRRVMLEYMLDRNLAMARFNDPLHWKTYYEADVKELF